MVTREVEEGRGQNPKKKGKGEQLYGDGWKFLVVSMWEGTEK